MTKIECLSVIPGYGKSTMAIDAINKAKKDDFIAVCVPLLKEIDRYLDACPEANLVQPVKRGRSKTKTEDLKHLVCNTDHNVIFTHHLYESIDSEITSTVKGMCRFGGTKTLIIDEALDVISQSSLINQEDMNTFLELGLVSVNKETGLVSALRSFPSKYKSTQNAIENGRVFFYADKWIVFEIGIDFLRAFDKVLILTHRFNTSILFNYLKTEGLEVNFMEPDKERVNEIKKAARERIVLLEDVNTDLQLSKSGFNKDPAQIKKELNRCIKQALELSGVPLEETRFTFFNSFGGMDDKAISRWLKTLLIGMGPQNKDNRPEAFLSHTVKATNDHQHCRLMVWGLQKHPHPSIIQCFSERGRRMNKVEWATSQLIQWLWRSNIRVTHLDEERTIPNEEPVYFAILDKEQREAFKRWLYSDEEEQGNELDDLDKMRAKRQAYVRWVKRDPAREVFTFEDYLKHGGGALKRKLKQAA